MPPPGNDNPVDAVIRELDDHRSRFVDLCRSLDEAELQRPVPGSQWQVRDFIAHLATIDPPVMAMLSRLTRKPSVADDPRDTTDGAPANIDHWNDDQVRVRRSWSLDDVLAEATRNRDHMRAFLATLDADDLQRPFDFRGDSKRPAATFPLGKYLRGWCKHDAMHAVDMLRALPEHVTPERQRWVDLPAVHAYQEAMNP